MRYEALVAPTVHLDNGPLRLHLPCYVTFHVRTGTNLRSSAFWVIVTVDEANRTGLRQYSGEVMVKGLTVLRRPMPADEKEGACTKATWDRRRAT